MAMTKDEFIEEAKKVSDLSERELSILYYKMVKERGRLTSFINEEFLETPEEYEERIYNDTANVLRSLGIKK